MKEKFEKHSIFTYYIATLIFTGMLLFPHFIWKDIGNYSVSFTQFGSMLAVMLMAAITKNRDIFLRIQKGVVFRWKDIKWCVLAIFLSFALVGISGALSTLFFGSDYSAWNASFAVYAINIVAMLCGGIGEEIGWRRFLLPTLQKRFAPFCSSLITGFLWGFWHLNYASAIVFYLLFIITTMELSILFTYLLNKTNGNILTAIIFHSAFNIANRIFVWERFNTSLLLIEIVVFGIACCIIVGRNRNWFFVKHEHYRGLDEFHNT